MILAIFVVIDLFLLAAITYFFPYTLYGYETLNENSVYLVCQSSSDVLLWIIAGIKALLTVWAMVLVIRIIFSHDKILFVEITQLGLVVYNVAILCAVLLVVFTFYGSSKPYIIIWLRGICLFYASMFTLMVFYTQRFYNAIFSPAKPNTNHTSHAIHSTIRSKETSEFAVSVDNADELPRSSNTNTPARSPRSVSKLPNFEKAVELQRLQQQENSMTIKSNNPAYSQGQNYNPANPQGLYNFFPNDAVSPLPSPKSLKDSDANNVYLTTFTGVSTNGKPMKMTKINRLASASPEPSSPISPRSVNFSYNQQHQPNSFGGNNLYSSNSNQQPMSANSFRMYNQNSVSNPLNDTSTSTYYGGNPNNVSLNNSNQSILGYKEPRSDLLTPEKSVQDNVTGNALSPDEAEIIRLRRENLQLRSNFEIVARENQEVIKQQDAILSHYQDIVYKAPSLVVSGVSNPASTSQNDIRSIKQNISSMKGGRNLKSAK